jgi:hypothetical protein
MPFVYIPVPEERVEEVYRLLGRSHRAEAGDDVDRLVQRVYQESDEQFRGLLRYLAGRPGQAVTTARAARHLKLPSGTASLAGMLGAYGRRANNRYDGFWPFSTRYNPVKDSKEFIMEPEVADLVRRVDQG